MKQVVISVPDEWLEGTQPNLYDVMGAVMNGTVLPEPHGRLIDADKTISKICGSSCGCHLEECGHDEPCFSVVRIKSAQTIIPATDKKRCETCAHKDDDFDCHNFCVPYDFDHYIPATKEKSCENCEHGFDSEDCYKCDKNIQNTCEPKQTATKEKCALTDCKCNDNGRCTDGLAYKESCYDCYQTATKEGAE